MNLSKISCHCNLKPLISQGNPQTLVCDNSRNLMHLWISAMAPHGKSKLSLKQGIKILGYKAEMHIVTGGDIKGTQYVKLFLVTDTLQN